MDGLTIDSMFNAILTAPRRVGKEPEEIDTSCTKTNSIDHTTTTLDPAVNKYQ